MALEGFGTSFLYKVGGSYVALAGIINADGPGNEVDMIAISDNDLQYVRTFPGIIDAGEVELELQYTSAQVSTLKSLLGVKDTVFRILYRDGSGWDFTGFLSKLPTTSPHDKNITNTVTFAVSGEATRIEAS